MIEEDLEVQGSGGWKWSRGQELTDTEILQRLLHEGLQENNRCGLSGKTIAVSLTYN